MFCIKIRKILLQMMFNKIGKMSLPLLINTNSGKLITIISSDIFTVHEGLIFAPYALATPFINVIFYFILWYMLGWKYAILTFFMWIILILVVFVIGNA